MPSIDYLVSKRKLLQSERSVWNRQFQILGQYVYNRKQQFETEFNRGSFLNDGSINDSTAPRALYAMVSAIFGSLWKSGGRTFRITRPDYISDSALNKQYYAELNKRLTRAMESEKAGFEPAMHESLSEQGVFGTSGLGVFQGTYQNPLIYRSWTLQSMWVAESQDEYIDTVYYDERKTVEAIVNEYGISKVSSQVREKYNNEKTRQEQVLICIAIEPRNSREKKTDVGALAMPYASYHFEPETKHMLRESGFESLPVKVSRWYKLPSEVYGRSPAMDALPAIMQINALKEAFLVGVEKKVEPPVFVLDDGTLGGATVDTSAGGLSVFNMSGRVNISQPVGVIFDVGELQSVAKLIEDTKLEIAQHFLIDKLYDLNNKSRMTLGEAEIRYDIRAEGLASIYARIINEQLAPIIERSFNILFDMGILGVDENDFMQQEILESNGIKPLVIPPEILEAMVAGYEIYELEWVSPAARILKDEEKRGIYDTLNAAIALANIDPMVLTNVDANFALSAFRELAGAPDQMIRPKQEAQAIRQAMEQAQAELAEAEKARLQSETMRALAQGNAMLTDTRSVGG